MIDRYNVWGTPFTLRHLADRLLRDAFVARPAEQSAPQVGAMDAYERDENLVVEIQMPGVKPEDVDVTLHQGLLTVRGRTTSKDERKERSYVVREQRAGSFTRQVRVSESLDADAVQATFEHGVLRLTLPKDARDRAHRIPITTGGPAAIESAASPIPTEDAESTSAEAAPEAPTTGRVEGSPTAADSSAASASAPTTRRSRSRKPADDAASDGNGTGRKPATRKPRARKATPTSA